MWPPRFHWLLDQGPEPPIAFSRALAGFPRSRGQTRAFPRLEAHNADRLPPKQSNPRLALNPRDLLTELVPSREAARAGVMTLGELGREWAGRMGSAPAQAGWSPPPSGLGTVGRGI